MNRTAETSPVGSRRLWTIPNVLSLLRLCAVPVFVWLFVTEREEAAVLVYAAGASSDFLDGYIARRTGSVTEIGKLLDPLADRIFIVALAVALVVRDALPVWLAVAVVARDVLVLVAWPVLDGRGLARIPVNFTGKCATASLLVGLTSLAWSETSWPLQAVADGVGITFTIVGAALYWIAGALYVRVLVSKASRRPGNGEEAAGPHER